MSELYSILNKLTPDEALSSTQPFYEEQKVLLWSNSSSSSAFPNQTISLNLTNYDSVEIFYQRTLGDYGSDILIHVGDVGVLNIAGAYNYIRGVTVSTTGVGFGQGSRFASYGSWTETLENEWCIPTKIYGIKKIGGLNLQLLIYNPSFLSKGKEALNERVIFYIK